LTQAFSLDSQSLDAIMTRASIYMSLKQYPRAVDDYERAAILSPTDSAVQALLAEAHAGSGDFADAIEAARRAHALSEAEGDAKASKVYLELIDDYRARKAAAPVKPSSSEVIEPKGDGSKGVPESHDPIHDREHPDGLPPDGPKPSRSQSS
jgi:tetratricopeptide (TPR) repeat protein